MIEAESILERTQRHKAALRAAEAKVAEERIELRRLIQECLAERYRASEVARALGVSRGRVDQLLHGR